MAGELMDNKGRGEAGWSWPAIHPEGRKFGLIAAAASLGTALMAWETIAWPLALLTLGVLAFFPQSGTRRAAGRAGHRVTG